MDALSWFFERLATGVIILLSVLVLFLAMISFWSIIENVFLCRLTLGVATSMGDYAKSDVQKRMELKAARFGAGYPALFLFPIQ
jgi:hypothetical protein